MLSSPYWRVGLTLSCTALMTVAQPTPTESAVVEEIEEQEQGQKSSLYQRTRSVFWLYAAASTGKYWIPALGECTMALYEKWPSSPSIKAAYHIFAFNSHPQNWWSSPGSLRVRPVTGLFLMGCSLVLAGSALQLWSRRVPPRRTGPGETLSTLKRGPYAFLKAPLGWGTVVSAVGALLCYHSPGTWADACIWGGRFAPVSVFTMKSWCAWVVMLPRLISIAVREDYAAWARTEEDDDD